MTFHAPTNPAEFEKNFNAGKTQLIWQWVASDMETPVSAYLKLCEDQTNTFLLESVEGGAALGRYSIIGMAPDFTWQADKSKSDIASLKKAIADSHIDIAPPELPPMAVSGLFGYIGYDMVRLVENIPDKNPDALNIPGSILIRPTILAIFDNVSNTICLVSAVYQHAKNSKTDAKTLYAEFEKRLRACAEKLAAPAITLKGKTKLSGSLDVKSNTEKSAFKQGIEKAIEYIYAGDIFQVVLSQRFETAFDLPPFLLYRTLRRLNPSPFLFYVNLGDFALVGSSPEILVRVRDNTATIRPIAGTRPRGKTPAEDNALAEELLADPKERAEHLMLLDLGRNDIGRIAKFGSVKVTDSFKIEKYSHVMHIVSNVEGKLADKTDIVDAFFSGFPAGTVSGAPKVRAMEIIDELEVARRSYYGGAVGYFSGNGTLDTCIALRTALIKDGKLYVQAGAGIVADSDPESEYQETVNKARAIIHAAEIAVEEAQKN